MTPTGVLETCLYASDLDAAEQFYGNTLGLERVIREGNRHVFFRMSTQMLLIFNPAETRKPASKDSLPIPTHGAEGAGHICFAATSDEISRWHDHLVAQGVEIDTEITWPNGAKSLYVRDPAGNSVEFAERRLWGFD